MAERSRLEPGKQGENSAVRRVKNKTGSRKVNAEVVGVPETSIKDHATMLTDVRSDQQQADMLTELQQTYGNSYVQRLLQTKKVQAKLAVNPPDDAYEKEADKVAQTVISSSPAVQKLGMPEEEEALQGKLNTKAQRQPEEEEIQAKPDSQLQRQEMPEEEEVQAKMISPIQREASPEEEELPLQGKFTTGVQRQPEEEEEPIQAKLEGGGVPEVSDNLEMRIETARGEGQSLPKSTRVQLESQLGHDFSGVRVHADAEADKLSKQLGAEAFTTQQDVFFREGTYQPEVTAGKGLLAHELTHVVQQSASPAIQRHDPTKEDGEAQENSDYQSARFAALQGVWETMVVEQLRSANQDLELPYWQNINSAIGKVKIAIETIGAIKSGYGDVPMAERSLAAFNNALTGLKIGLEAHVGKKMPIPDIRYYLNPDGEWMPPRLDQIRKVL